VTYSVARTRINIAPRVNTTMRIVVRTDARIIFIGLESGRPEAAWRRITQPEEKQNAEPSAREIHQRRHLTTQRKPDQSSATRIESLGFEASYLMLAGCPATSRSNRTWLSNPVMSCAVWYVTPEIK